MNGESSPTVKTAEEDDKAYMQLLLESGIAPDQAEFLVAVRHLTADSYKEMLQTVHGGLFRVFSDLVDERSRASRLIKDTMTRLSTMPHVRKYVRQRQRMILEAELLSRILGRLDEALARVNHLMQNSIFTVAMQYAAEKRVQQCKAANNDTKPKKIGYEPEVANDVVQVRDVDDGGGNNGDNLDVIDDVQENGEPDDGEPDDAEDGDTEEIEDEI